MIARTELPGGDAECAPHDSVHVDFFLLNQCMRVKTPAAAASCRLEGPARCSTMEMLVLIEPSILSRRITDAIDEPGLGKPSTSDDEPFRGALVLAAETVTPLASAPEGNLTVAPAVLETVITCSWALEDTVKQSDTYDSMETAEATTAIDVPVLVSIDDLIEDARLPEICAACRLVASESPLSAAAKTAVATEIEFDCLLCVEVTDVMAT